MSQISIYKNVKAFHPYNAITLDEYVQFIKEGTFQDSTIEARRLRQIWKENGSVPSDEHYKAYQAFKQTVQGVTGSALMHKDKNRSDANIKDMNGYIFLDIDEEVSEAQYLDIANDKYVRHAHRSIGGDGFVLIVPINPDKFKDSFNGLADHFFKNYNVRVDMSCSNPSRFRYMSWDPDIITNEGTKKFIAKDVKRFKAPTKTDFIYNGSDFDKIMEQINTKNVDLTKDDYFRYMRIGMSLASQFNHAGEDYFHLIASKASKYKYDIAKRDYTNFCKRNIEKISIGTFYYYAKEEGLEIYSQRTKDLINRVKVAKSQGNPTIEGISKTIEIITGEALSDDEKVTVQHLIESKADYSAHVDSELSEIEQLEKYIIENHNPEFDTISRVAKINGAQIDDMALNNIYLGAKRLFDFRVNMSDVKSILNSSYIPKSNAVMSLIEANSHLEPEGLIDGYIDLIEPRSDYNRWAFKRWLVGAVHNWTADYNDNIVCPLTLVLCGGRHGAGKTSFLREILPKELKGYFTEQHLSPTDKDSFIALTTRLMHCDNEFGSKLARDHKAFKKMADENIIDLRRPYTAVNEMMKRRCILSGTTNELDILKDVSGDQRRILPINVDTIDYVKLLSYDKIGMIMEAYNLLQSGFEWNIYKPEDVAYLKEHTQVNVEETPIEDMFYNNFSFKQDNEYRYEVIYNKGDFTLFFQNSLFHRITKHELNDLLKAVRAEYKNHKLKDGSQRKGVKLYMKFKVGDNYTNTGGEI